MEKTKIAKVTMSLEAESLLNQMVSKGGVSDLVEIYFGINLSEGF